MLMEAEAKNSGRHYNGQPAALMQLKLWQAAIYKPTEIFPIDFVC